MTGLAKLLVSRRPRETGGATASNRLAYQRTWALCQLLELHAKNATYALVMEYHDDVVVLDDDNLPKEAAFYQVKTRASGHYTQTQLLKAKFPSVKSTQKVPAVSDASARALNPPAPHSTLGKLISHWTIFGPYVKSLNVVSNVPFSVPLADGTKSILKTTISAADLKIDSLDEISRTVKAELDLGDAIPWEKVFFRREYMGVNDHEVVGLGRLAEFLEFRKPGASYPVKPLYRSIDAELQRKSNCERIPATFVELCKLKAICRSDLEALLRTAETLVDPDRGRREAIAQLQLEGLTYRQTMQIDAEWRRYIIEILDPANFQVHTFREMLLPVVEIASGSGAWQTLQGLVELATAQFNAQYGVSCTMPRAYLQGAILHEHTAREGGKLSSTNSQSPQEN